MYQYSFHSRRNDRPTTAKDATSARLEKFKMRKQKEIMAQFNKGKFVENSPAPSRE